MAARGRVLLVEDDPNLCEVLDEVLRGAGYSVVTATTAGAAVALLKIWRFDIVLLDAVIPEGGSGEVAKLAQQARIPVLLTSGYPDQIAELSVDGEHAFLCKPFRPAELIAQVGRLLEGVQTGSQERRPIIGQ